MKWTLSTQKSKNPNDLDFDSLDPGEKQHFNPITLTKDDKNAKYLSEELKKELEGKNYGVWAVYEVSRDYKPKEKRKYEIFCGGFLAFFDLNFLAYLKELNAKSAKSGVTVDETILKDYFKDKGLIPDTHQNAKLQLEHNIFFEWGKGDGTTDKDGNVLDPKKDYVRIYINPPAGNPDPPKPPGPPPPESVQ